MKPRILAATLLALTSSITIPAFARDDGPRFASDRLDTLVEQHAQAARHIADKQPVANAERTSQAPK